jgi:23S rRNA (uracil-5-)-methyltransferase RumA
MYNSLSASKPKLLPADRECFGCGSCFFNEYSYDQVSSTKKQWIEELFKQYSHSAAFTVSPISRRYRNKMDFVAHKDKIGFRSGGFMNVYDVKDTCLADKMISELLEKLRKFSLYPYYNLKTHEGIIRYFVFRQGRYAGKKQLMLNLVLKEVPENFIDDFAFFLKSNGLYDTFDSIVFSVNSGKGDVSFGEQHSFIKQDFILQELSLPWGVFTFKIKPNSFFQSNIEVFQEALITIAAILNKEADNPLETILYDLFGGMASIGIPLSRFVKKVHSVEINPENIISAKENINRNQIENIEIYESDVYEFLKTASIDANSIFVFDPPRAGLGKKTVEFILSLELKPKLIIYMSCNPLTQKEDLDMLSAAYKVTDIHAFDMFPFTPHVENITALKLR